jgi:glycosyltransferase involved in cell wall biosynthesis
VPRHPKRLETDSAPPTRSQVPPAAGARDPAPNKLSAIVLLTPGVSDVEKLHHAYARAVQAIGLPYEFVYVLCAGWTGSLAVLEKLHAEGEPVTVVVLRRWPGEARALANGLDQAQGDVILTLPPRLQVDPDEIPRVVAALEGCEMAIARRSPDGHAGGRRRSERLFHWLLKATFGHAFSDLVCQVRACRRRVLDEISLFGVQHHFSPLLALQRGFTIKEVEVQPGTARGTGRRSFWAYASAMLDILALYVLLKFTRKPLRFFGAIGGPLLLAGLLFTTALAVGRLFFGIPLGDRPALILGVLLIVLGIQIIALGLIGEIIIFASGKSVRDYSVEKIIGPRADRTGPPRA